MLIVQKFGGTSVGDLERIQNVASRVSETKKAGNDVVVVVSAMSGETNKLVAYAEHFSSNPARAEMDMLLSSGERVTASLLAIALNEMGHEAISMTGRKAGIVTDSLHTKARIEEINPTAMNEALKEGKIIVVAGFQGVSTNGNVTTLGRGGSDLSAVAIAGAIKADLCEIYTDVSGIFTTDPRIEPKARKLTQISYDEMLELASLGAKVLQNRSVELAKKLNVNLVTRTSFSNEEGTLITKEENIMEKPLVSGIALDKGQARISLMGVADRPGIASEIFNKLAKSGVNIDMIVQNKAHNGETNIDFTIPSGDLNDAKLVVHSFVKDGDIKDESYNETICKVSVVGVGMKSHTGVAAKAFSAMAKENININMISTSEIKVSMVIDEKYGELAVRSLHDAYELEK
ncbi:MAG: aspartate kinase [Epsilonproteobacteria bacterium]|nr:aspartate kinase [Campylobacterota bacterium]OIO15555.1 MAG: aspartate kinase [Helicobacteraceae bacterium CG1_02_36_14]PIP09786.1 MAG: aspartate kinase [Sulfurimonas sp. CG23_combo_of_CG06-09_8_20_14_all_36_33]PIS24000.1 MAG: aspartate kinase [Sulfurimonas sp. CG08_land_8_20_14_0_20_36_33]PIU35484.1 MAG: aspartate kinase [Sulfurimonas sp. CG07_land_8_20_14_0_80_36_56]PIV05405.1 MAG: aspartate kinase [Sulfurimonas sp. CG03_land_8_20_14_0_80_36_25]PIV37046.1 MAG: aspartate kinase [Sulfurimo